MGDTATVPVVDPMTVGYRYTELLLGAGLVPAPFAAAGTAPSPAEVDQLLRSLA